MKSGERSGRVIDTIIPESLLVSLRPILHTPRIIMRKTQCKKH